MLHAIIDLEKSTLKISSYITPLRLTLLFEIIHTAQHPRLRILMDSSTLPERSLQQAAIAF